MEHYIIDPIRDLPSGAGDSEEDLLLSKSADLQKAEEPSLLGRVGSVLGFTEPPRQGGPAPRGYLHRKISRLKGREARGNLLDGGLTPRSDAAESKVTPPLQRSTTLMQHVAARSRAFVVYAISKQGLEESVMQTYDLLTRIHMHNKKHELEQTAAGAVKVRDIRLFLSASRDGSSILTRRNCLLVSLPYVRMVILHGLVFMLPIGKGNFRREARKFEQTEWRCKLLRQGMLCREEDNEVMAPNSEGASSVMVGASSPSALDDLPRRSSSSIFISAGGGDETQVSEVPPLTEIDSTLLEKLTQLVALESSTPFEYLALETAIVESDDVLSRQVREMRQTAASICVDLRTGRGVNSSILLSINSLRKMLDGLKSEAAGVLTALNEVLSDDNTLRRVAISRFWDTPELWEEESPEVLRRSGQWAIKHEVEMLLGCYSQEADSMLKSVKSIDEYIDDSLAMIELHLGMQRNFLLKTDVWMTALATITGFFSLVPGIFGMNIHHGFENVSSSQSIFWSITAAIFMGTIITGIVVSCMLRRLRI
ncbi:CorA family Mg2+ transporter protein [Besnoitia besnoiti]|uniref:Magnesium transporter n=1 Tax=Besnoitia besnoiti TaxID=94643 RepID=A0A2A9MKH2_BESBE|nr:CorA family Mg2+ transporter protein [Besnoitia besnoiti]PFH38429.1 CorA family Mg2+ transporter protein [Besnoitia besnoiti]